MMLIVLDKDPIEAVKKVPESIKHKQLLELMQMLSCVVGFGYENFLKEKKIKEWISKYKKWVYYYAETIYEYLDWKQSLKKTTRIKYRCLLDLLWCECENEKYVKPTTAILRYKEGYECKYPTNTELPIEECIKIYEDYTKWKGWE